MRNSSVKTVCISVAVLFSAMLITAAYAADKGDPVGNFFKRLFGWPAKTGEKAGETVVNTAEQAGKTGAKTVEDTGKSLVGKENPIKIVTTPVTGTAKTGEKAAVGTGKTAATAVTACPVYPSGKK
ncbi:MAG: hypothetical protein ABIH01_00675 [Candidatus Omnitrophota bacterium]